MQTRNKPRDIIKQIVKDVDDEVLAKLPSTTALRQKISRERNKNKIKLKEPKDLRELIVPEHYKKTYKGKLFLLDDSWKIKTEFFCSQQIQT